MEAIGPYQVLSELGRGGMGAVYLARDARSGEQVALKLLTRAHEASPAQRQRFQREARALAKDLEAAASWLPRAAQGSHPELRQRAHDQMQRLGRD
ncbi:MAG: hypothetical protein AB7N76_22085 [Planctomycetota bacterium]